LRARDSHRRGCKRVEWAIRIGRSFIRSWQTCVTRIYNYAFVYIYIYIYIYICICITLCVYWHIRNWRAFLIVDESVAGHEENCLIEPLLSADSYESLSSPRVMIIDLVVNATDVARTITEIQNRSFRAPRYRWRPLAKSARVLLISPPREAFSSAFLSRLRVLEESRIRDLISEGGSRAELRRPHVPRAWR